MTTCREVLKSAYRRSGVNAHGKDLDQIQSTVGLEILQDMLINGVGGGLFGRLTRYIHDSATAYTVATDQIHIHDIRGSGIILPTRILAPDGDYRLPYPGAVIIWTDILLGKVHTYVYNQSSHVWQELEALTLTAECPFTPAKTKAIKDWLAVEVADEIGMPPDPIRVRKGAAGRLAIATNYGTEEIKGGVSYF